MVALQESQHSQPGDPAGNGKKARAPLSRERILAAGIAVVEQQGFDGLTIRNVAKELGFAPMALYTHIKNKDELVDDVLDSLLSGIQFYNSMSTDWQDQLRQFVRAYRAFLLRYRDAVPHLMAGAAHSTPGARRVFETLLRIFRHAEYEDEGAVMGAFTVLQFVHGSTYLAAAPLNTDPMKIRAELQALPASQYTSTVRAGPELGRLPANERFDATLDVLVKGLEEALPRPGGGIGRIFGFGRR
jgi:AcrR family transcriptional regulator